MLRRILKFLVLMFFGSLALGWIVALIFQLYSVQTYFAQKVAASLAEKFKTEVKIKSLQVTFSRNIRLKEVMVRDYDNDTMIYAGMLDVHYSGWQLLKRKIQIKGIRLENVHVHLQKDTTGKLNLNEVFGLTKKKTGNDSLKIKKTFQWGIELRELNLLNTHFDFNDKRGGTIVSVDVPRSLIKLNDLGLKSSTLNVHELTMIEPLVDITLNPHPKINPDTLKPAHFLPEGFKIVYGKVLLTGAKVKVNNIQKPYAEKGIDFNHLNIRDINLNIAKGMLIRDSIHATIRSLSATEKCGLKVLSLRAEATVTVNEILCEKMLLRTPGSVIGNHISLKFGHFKDFGKFMEKVRLKGDLQRSKIALSDLNLFVKKLDQIEHNTIFISGNIDGRVNNMRGRNIELRTGKSTFFKGSFFTFGLPQIFETSLNLRVINSGVSIQDIKTFYPALKIPDNISSLGNISFSGNMDGFITDFVANGKFNTAIGSANSNLNFKYNPKTKDAAYSGDLALKNFNLGKFTRNEKNIGIISANATIRGKGLTLEKLEANVDGTIEHLVLKEYDYKNAQVNGFVKGKNFIGNLTLRDKNIDFDFDGSVDLNKPSPEFNFVSNIRHANLHALNLSKEPFTFSTQVSSNFNGKDIDDVAGNIVLRNTRLSTKDTSATLDFIQLQGYVESDKKKSLLLRSKVAEAEISGFYSYSKLYASLKRIVQNAFNQRDDMIASNGLAQDFSFSLRIFEPGALTEIIHPDFKIIRNTKIIGVVNSGLNQISLNGFVPEFQWGKTNLQRTSVIAGILDRHLDASLITDNVYLKDSLIMDTLKVQLIKQRDKLLVNLLAMDKKHINRGNIDAELSPLNDGLRVKLLPSEVWLATNLWKFSDNNQIVIRGKKITSENFIFSSNRQSVSLEAYLSDDSSTSLKAVFSQMSLSDFSRIFMPKDAGMSATINGYATIQNVLENPSVLADLKLQDFVLGEIPIGDVNVLSELDRARNRMNIVSNVSGKNNDWRAYGFYSFEKNKPDLNLNIDLRNLELDFLNYPFFKPYVKNVVGKASGKLQLQGSLSKLALTGKLKIDTAAVTVSYLNTRYGVKNQEVSITENNININYLTLLDLNSNDKRTAVANGRIYHNYFKKFGIDLRVITQNAMMLNTTAEMNPVFYGKALADGSINFQGPFNDMTIRANVRTMPGTYVYLPIRSTKETGRYTFFQFVDKKAETEQSKTQPKLKLNGLRFILEADVTPDAAIDIVLDPVAGDILTSVGRGNIKLEIPKTGNVTMYGTYEVARGDYLFTLQNVVNKRFKMDPGSTINFTGDIYQAQLNVDAVYDVRTSTYDLISDFFERTSSGELAEGEAETRARSSIPVKLLLKLTGVLSSPNVAFDIQTIDPDPTIRTMVDNRLQIIRTNETEMYKQVFGLLMMNRFLPPGNTINNAVGGNAIGGGLANTVGEFLSSQLSLYLNNFVSNFVDDLDINFRYRQYSQQGFGGEQSGDDGFDTRRELQLALTKRFFNDRFSISAGGNVDFGNTTVVDNTGTGTNRIATANVAGDFQVEYKLTKDGRWRLRAFNRTDYDNFNLRNRNRTGIGLNFRKDFDNVKDLFKPTKRKKKTSEAVKPDAIEIREEDVPEIQ